MRFSLCLHAAGIAADAFAPIPSSDPQAQSAFGRSVSRAASFDPGEGHTVDGRYLIVDAGVDIPALPDGITVVRPADESLESYLLALEGLGDAEAVLVVQADAPLWDSALARRLLDVHVEYIAEFTFADGFPEGLAAEVVSRGIIPALIELAKRNPGVGGRRSLFDIVEKDINAFDVETELSSEDMRMLRVRLRADSKLNRLVCQGVLEEVGSISPDDAESVISIIQSHPEHLRTVPAFLSVQLLSATSQEPFYLPKDFPFAGAGRELAADDFASLLADFEALAAGGAVEVSSWGEIALHSEVEAILEASNKTSCRFLVQTSGVGWSADVVESVQRGAYPNITWIVALDAYSEETYKRVRGPGYGEAMAFATGLLEHLPERVYLQSTRLQENEEDLEGFYREWKKRTTNIIIQKYDHFCTRLPDRRVVDNAPVKRLPCWHLKRDVVVLVDGSVPMCREDLDRSHHLGNALTDGIEAVWEAGRALYQRHTQGDYPDLCRKCDEYYTFTF